MIRLLITGLALATALPASAQIFWKSPDYSGAPITLEEPGIGVALPGATPAEQRANLVWQLRAGLNVAALQCQRFPTLMSRDVYGGVLINHKEELAKSYATLANYFKRTEKTVKAGQQALDRYGTKTYIGTSTVQGILGFCQTSAHVGRSALYAPRGSLYIVALERLREFRNSLLPGREQQFNVGHNPPTMTFPNLAKACWNRKTDAYDVRCGLNPI
ncbi:Gluconate 2-dehydrogenase subunit 3 [Sphingomonas antarctica]|uniref:hypothetical protein n=1 Tax=Sphingomonas antarctica TaxID=2040274 RepID=UPI0039EADFEF